MALTVGGRGRAKGEDTMNREKSRKGERKREGVVSDRIFPADLIGRLTEAILTSP